jgi:hypothetical protein
MNQETNSILLYAGVTAILTDYRYNLSNIGRSHLTDQGKEAILHLVESLGPSIVTTDHDHKVGYAQLALIDTLTKE